MYFKFLTIALIAISIAQAQDFNYIGCFLDSDVSELGEVVEQNSDVESCTMTCGTNGFSYSGLSNGGECRCANEYGSLGQVNEIECIDPCDSNLSTVCGGGQRNSIYHSQGQCSGEGCFSEIDLQGCYDDLYALMHNSMNNICYYETINNEIYYNFEISYINGYVFDQECLSQSIVFEGQEFQGYLYDSNTGLYTYGSITQSSLPLNSYAYIPGTNSIKFSIRHLDMEDLDCAYNVTDEEYHWQCNIDLNIFFAGNEQLTYSFCMDVVLDRVYINGGDGEGLRRERPLTVFILPNEMEAEGDCCENELFIQTELKFCESLACDVYIPDDPLVVTRKESFFVEHSIITEEFKHYYLHRNYILLGAFIPDVLAFDGSNRGRTMYEIRSNVAMESMVLEVRSKIDEQPYTLRRRALQQNNQEIRDDYVVNQFQLMNVQEKTENETNLAAEKENKGSFEKFVENGGNVFALTFVSLLFVTAVMMVSYVVFKQVSLKKLQQEKISNIKNIYMESQSLGGMNVDRRGSTNPMTDSEGDQKVSVKDVSN